MIATLLALLITSFPSPTQTSWMEPEAFHLKLGMKRSKVMAQLKSDGWTTTAGKEPHHLIVLYDEGKTITLSFRNSKLESARFELVAFIPEVQRAFQEKERRLAEKRGQPTRRVENPILLSWEEKTPNVVLVLSTARETSFGQQGLGFLVVRYFVPPTR